MATSSFTKNFELTEPKAQERFAELEAKRGVVLRMPKEDPLKKGREQLAQRFASCKN